MSRSNEDKERAALAEAAAVRSEYARERDDSSLRGHAFTLKFSLSELQSGVSLEALYESIYERSRKDLERTIGAGAAVLAEREMDENKKNLDEKQAENKETIRRAETAVEEGLKLIKSGEMSYESTAEFTAWADHWRDGSTVLLAWKDEMRRAQYDVDRALALGRGYEAAAAKLKKLRDRKFEELEAGPKIDTPTATK